MITTTLAVPSASQLDALGERCFRAPDRTVQLILSEEPLEIVPLRSSAARDWLMQQVHRLTGEIPASVVVDDLRELLEARTRLYGEERTLSPAELLADLAGVWPGAGQLTDAMEELFNFSELPVWSGSPRELLQALAMVRPEPYFTLARHPASEPLLFTTLREAIPLMRARDLTLEISLSGDTNWRVSIIDGGYERALSESDREMAIFLASCPAA